MTAQDFVYVCRPQLPDAEAIVAYIRGIDARRHYTNRGPLVALLEQRLAAALGRPDHTVRSTASGTSALEVAILAHAGLARPERPLALIPSFTFAATGLAVERCGYRAHFVDVDPEDWCVDAAALTQHPLIGQAGLVVSVAPYGVLPDMAALETLQDATGVPVVVDAAAAFEALLDRPETISAKLPMALSFHATKTFSTGEGGGIVWDDPAGQDRSVQIANFGFFRSRECKLAGTNAKMSEYHAAIGLAMLDTFPARRRDYAAVTAQYHAAQAAFLPQGRLHLPPRLSSAYALWEAADPHMLMRVETALSEAGIETRHWYEAGLQAQLHFAGAGRAPLPVTDRLGAQLLGLPMGHDLPLADTERMMQVMQGALDAIPA